MNTKATVISLIPNDEHVATAKPAETWVEYVALQLKLEEMAADEAGHARELRRILRGL